MELVRVGEKLISGQKICRVVERILQMRHKGYSQQEVATRLKLDRSFISRLEAIGEVRKGGRIALFGFPVKNVEEIKEIARSAGVEYIFLLNNTERWRFVEEKSGMEFFNEVMKILADLRQFDTVILVGSTKWLTLAEALLDSQVLFVDLGPSPIEGDRYLDPEKFKRLLRPLVFEGSNKGGTVSETCGERKSWFIPSQQ